MNGRRSVAFVIHDLNTWGGQDRSTLEIARRLSHKFPVDIISYTLDDNTFPESWGDVRFHRIRPNIRRPAVLKILYFHLATALFIVFYRLFKKGHRLLIHSCGTSSLLSEVIQVQFVQSAWKKSKPTNQRGSLYHETLLSLNAWFERITFTRNKTYIAIADCVKKELQENFGVGEQTRIIHHGVNPDVFYPPALRPDALERRKKLRTELGIADQEIAILFVGAYERKGLAASLEALARLPAEQLKRTKLLAVGNGNSPAFVEQARKLGIADHLVLVSHQKDVIPYYWCGDIFLLPTLYEPFGLVITEAMACGLAPIVSKIAGGSELIRDQQSGFLLDNPADPSEIATKLERLLKDDTSRVRIADQAFQAARERSWEKVAEEYRALLQPMITPGKHP